jgi:hypothetical protein
MAQKKEELLRVVEHLARKEERSDLGEKFGSENPKKVICKSMAS